MPSAIRLDLGARSAVIREGSADPLALSLAVASRYPEVMRVLAYPGFAERRRELCSEAPVTPGQALDLRVLADVPEWPATLARSLGQEVELTPRLVRRVSYFQREAKRMRESVLSIHAPALDEVAQGYESWLQAQGWELYGYQLKDAARYAAKGRGLISYQMRLGKTRVAGAAVLARRCQRILVVADAGPLNVWHDELQEVFGLHKDQVPFLAYGRELGGALAGASRAQIRAKMKAFLEGARRAAAGRPLFILASFNLLGQSRKDRTSKYNEYPITQALLQLFKPSALIVDEAHNASNRETQHGHVLSQLHAPVMYACTGTPTNGRETAQTTLPGWLGSGRGRWAYPWRRHVRLGPVYRRGPAGTQREPGPVVNALAEVYVPGPDLKHLGPALSESSRWRLTGESAHRAWNARVSPLMVVREEKDRAVKAAFVAKEPVLEPIYVPFDPEHELFYKKVREELKELTTHLAIAEADARARLIKAGYSGADLDAEVSKATGAIRALSARRFFNTLQKLGMVSTCPWDGRVMVAGALERYHKTPAKYAKVIELTREALRAGEKVVIPGHFEAYTSRLAHDLRHDGVLDMVRGLDGRAKREMLRRFWNDPASRILLLSTASGGEAIDVSIASRMIVADLDDRMTKFTQVLRRICGPKQTAVPKIQLVFHTLSDPQSQSVDLNLYEYLTKRKAMADLARNDLAVPSRHNWLERAERLLR